MAISDKKKVQTLINSSADCLIKIREEMTKLNIVKTKFNTANPDVTGTPLEGNLASLNSALTALTLEADKQIWTNMINAKIPSHRGEAL